MFNIASKARPVFGAVVLTAGLLTAGGIYPEVTFPRVAVVAKKPGLDLVSTELQVTRPLELAVTSVLGVRRVRSSSIRGGSDLSIDFAPGTDMNQALQLTWNRIGAARGQLPPDVELTVEQMTPSVFPIMSVVLTGGNSPAQLRDFAFYELAPQIKTIPDVLYANVAGGDIREIEVVARPDSTPPPAYNTGRSARASASTILTAVAASIVGRAISAGTFWNASISRSAEKTSIGMSTSTGPGRPV